MASSGHLPPAGPWSRRLLAAVDGLLAAAAACWLAGRFVDDSQLRAQWLAYLPGLPLAGAAILWLLLRRRAAPAFRALIGVVAAAALVDFLANDVRWRPDPPPAPGELAVEHWNIARGAWGLPRVLETLHDDAPDLLLLSELPHHAGFTGEVARATGLPHVRALENLLMASRTPIHVREGRVPLRNARGWSADVEVAGGRLRILLLDVPSRPDLDRLSMAEDIAAWVARQPPAMPLLVVGDQNTPRRAGSLEPIRGAGLRHAYELAGRGWPFSWPLPFPCYALDHLWLGPGVEAVAFRYRASLASDHLRQIARLRVADPDGGTRAPDGEAKPRRP